MKTKQWDIDIEKSLKELGIADEEIKQHMYNLWSLSDGKIGKKPPKEILSEYDPEIRTNLMSGKIEGETKWKNQLKR